MAFGRKQLLEIAVLARQKPLVSEVPQKLHAEFVAQAVHVVSAEQMSELHCDGISASKEPRHWAPSIGMHVPDRELEPQ